jgi:hypothetical protein
MINGIATGAGLQIEHDDCETIALDGIGKMGPLSGLRADFD